MENPEAWIRATRVDQDSLSPTELETKTAVSSVIFRWTDTRIIKGLSSFVKNVRSKRTAASSSRVRGSADEKDYSNRVGTRSAPNTQLSRHKSAAATMGTRDNSTHNRGKEVMSHQAHPQPRRVSPRAETSSTASMKSSHTNKSATFEPFAMWGAGSSGSGRKSRRNSNTKETSTHTSSHSSTTSMPHGAPALAIDSLQVSSLTVPSGRGPSRVGSPQPLTPNSAGGTSSSTSQIPSPVSDPSPSQPTPPERPTSRLSNFLGRMFGKGKDSGNGTGSTAGSQNNSSNATPTAGSSEAASMYSRGPSPQEASTSSLVPMSTTLAPFFSVATAVGVGRGTGVGRGSSVSRVLSTTLERQAARRDLTGRRSEDAFHQVRGRQSEGSVGGGGGGGGGSGNSVVVSEPLIDSMAL